MTAVTVRGLGDTLGIPFDLADFDRDAAELTTEHAATSYGQAVLVRDGRVYGPGDLPGVTLYLSTTSAATAGLIGPARAGGWTVHVSAWCDWCGNELSDPETRRPGDVHPECATTREIVRRPVGVQ